MVNYSGDKTVMELTKTENKLFSLSKKAKSSNLNVMLIGFAIFAIGVLTKTYDTISDSSINSGEKLHDVLIGFFVLMSFGLIYAYAKLRIDALSVIKKLKQCSGDKTVMELTKTENKLFSLSKKAKSSNLNVMLIGFAIFAIGVLTKTYDTISDSSINSGEKLHDVLIGFFVLMSFGLIYAYAKLRIDALSVIKKLKQCEDEI